MSDSAPNSQPLFVFGFPRSGTTLLQRILNSYEDVIIWGEHVGFLRDVANAYFRVWRNPDFFRSTVPLNRALDDPASATPWPAWMNWTTEEEWRALYRRFVESVFMPGNLPSKRFWGWKEVHYSGTARDQTLPFLGEVFPDALYVFLVRNAFNNLASFGILPRKLNIAAWKRDGCDRWSETMRSFRRWHDSARVRSFWIHYEELARGEGELLGLLETMGKEFGDAQRAVLRSEVGRVSSFQSNRFDERWTELSKFRLAIAARSVAAVNRRLGYQNPVVPTYVRVAALAAAPFLTLMYHGSRVVPWLRGRTNGAP